MKILYVGPLMMINKLVPMSKRIFPSLEFDYITYERYTDAPDLLEHYDKKVDAVLFSGKSPYKICENQMNQSILMDYVPRHETTLYRVLLEITYLLKRDICRLSVDTYDKKMMQKLYKEIHVELREDSVFLQSKDIWIQIIKTMLLRFIGKIIMNIMFAAVLPDWKKHIAK